MYNTDDNINTSVDLSIYINIEKKLYWSVEKISCEEYYESTGYRDDSDFINNTSLLICQIDNENRCV